MQCKHGYYLIMDVCTIIIHICWALAVSTSSKVKYGKRSFELGSQYIYWRRHTLLYTDTSIVRLIEYREGANEIERDRLEGCKSVPAQKLDFRQNSQQWIHMSENAILLFNEKKRKLRAHISWAQFTVISALVRLCNRILCHQFNAKSFLSPKYSNRRD